MKKYNSFEELVKEATARRGYDSDLESICHYQDLIGHSTYEQLEALANGEQKEMFYNLYSLAEGPIAAIKFYAQYSNYCCTIRDEKSEEEAKRQRAEKRLKEAEESYGIAMASAEKNRLAWLEEKNRADEAQKQIEAQAAEIIQLKAKLYDLMTK